MKLYYAFCSFFSESLNQWKKKKNIPELLKMSSL